MKKFQVVDYNDAVRDIRLAGWLAVAVAISAPALAIAQQPSETASGQPPLAIEEITVTGTSIKGQAPVGKNVISIGRAQIEQSGAQTTQQLLSSIPQITGMGNAGQGSYGSADGSGTYAPTIHSMGASASNGTLILIDGHRLPLSGLAHTLADPTVIPPIAVQRVEVLPTGASAIYGSDAVAGVINFITRKNYNGFQISSQIGYGDGYNKRNVGILAGTSWDDGSALIAYSYSYRSSLEASDRSFIKQDLRSEGGANFAGYYCAPATVQVGGVRYSYPYGPGDVLSTAPCDLTRYDQVLPEETRNNLLVRLEQDINDDLSAHVDLVYGQRKDRQLGGGATLSSTAYGPGSTPPAGHSINPFFVGPRGVTQETVYFQANDLLGRSSESFGRNIFFIAGGLDYDINGNWSATVGITAGRNHDYSRGHGGRGGSLCSWCVDQAVNGPNLTVNNALNVWGAAGSSAAGGADTSSDVFSFLNDSYGLQESEHTLMDIRAAVSGTAFSIPGGPVKVSLGVESIRYGLTQDTATGGGGGPASTNAQTIHTSIGRDVRAVFGELLIPTSSRTNLDLAVRYDHYSDFGGTTNPAISFDWTPVDSLRMRASWSTSFTAPALTSRGEAGTGRTTESGWGQAPPFSPGYIGPNYSDPRTAQFLATVPGCTPSGCVINTPGGITGLWVTGGNDKLKAATGESWTIGFDLTRPDFLPGLTVHATYWDSLYEGMITAPTLRNITAVPGLNDRAILLPTAAEIAQWTAGLPQTGSVPPNVYFIWSFQQINAFNIDAAGVDLSVAYDFDTSAGSFEVGFNGAWKTRFMQQSAAGAPWVSFLDTDVNTTFPSLDFLGSAHFAWNGSRAGARIDGHYTGSYRRPSNPLQHTVDSFMTFDVHAYYTLGDPNSGQGTRVFVDVSNLMDEEPPFFNDGGGYNGSLASPIGRVVSIGFRKSW